jgi:hypothetical protein
MVRISSQPAAVTATLVRRAVFPRRQIVAKRAPACTGTGRARPSPAKDAVPPAYATEQVAERATSDAALAAIG